MPLPDLTLGYHLVVFLDLLGQRDKLRRLIALPQTAEEMNEAARSLADTAGAVISIRDGFSTLFEGATRVIPDVLDGLSPERREHFLSLRRLTIRQRGFADSVVITVPLRGSPTTGEVVAANGVWAALQAVAGLSLAALAGGHPIRGGMDIGVGVEIYDGEYYGDALTRAYVLESQQAEYPRVLVGQGVLEYLTYLERLPGTTPENRLASLTATRCRALIVTAPDDGLPMVDSLAIGGGEFAQFSEIARERVEQWRLEFEREANEKLASRYSRLAQYLRSRR